MSIKDGGPAFPVADYDHMVFEPATVDETKRDLSGMTLRDYFAAKALPIAADQFKRLADVHYPEEGLFLHPDGFEATARAAYALADAMLAARGAQ